MSHQTGDLRAELLFHFQDRDKAKRDLILRAAQCPAVLLFKRGVSSFGLRTSKHPVLNNFRCLQLDGLRSMQLSMTKHGG